MESGEIPTPTTPPSTTSTPPSRPSTITFAKGAVVGRSRGSRSPEVQDNHDQEVILSPQGVPDSNVHHFEEVTLQFRGGPHGEETNNNTSDGGGGLGRKAVETFSGLYYSSALSDVSLMLEGTLVKGHKLVLAMSSPYFRALFEELSSLPCPHFHPVVAVRGVSYKEWEFLRCLLYHGAVRVAREEVDGILAAAEALQIEDIEAIPSITPSHGINTPTFMEEGESKDGLIRKHSCSHRMDAHSTHPGAAAAAATLESYKGTLTPSSHHDIRYRNEMALQYPTPQSLYGLRHHHHDDYDVSRDGDASMTHSPPEVGDSSPTPTPSNPTFRLQLSPEQVLPLDSSSSVRRRERRSHEGLHPLRIRSLSTSPVSSSPMSGTVPHCLRYSTEEVNNMIRAVEHLPGNLVPCAICRKNVKRERLRPHINECHLLDGKRILCPLCCVAFKSKGSYRVHIWRHRRGTAGQKFPNL